VVLNFRDCLFCIVIWVPIGWVVVKLSSEPSTIPDNCSRSRLYISATTKLFIHTRRDVTYCGWGSVVHRDRCIACFGRPFAQGAEL